MEGIQTTSLDSLPQNNNIQVTTSEKNEVIHSPGVEEHNARINSESVNNELVSGIQQAAVNGGTLLQSRDIPIDTTGIVSDENVKPNHIPEMIQETDYITKHQTSEEIIRQNEKKLENLNRWDNIYNELNLPILISSLFFIFQLPAIQNQLLSLFPFFYTKAGKIKITGRLLQGFIFGLIVYVSNRVVLLLNN